MVLFYFIVVHISLLSTLWIDEPKTKKYIWQTTRTGGVLVSSCFFTGTSHEEKRQWYDPEHDILACQSLAPNKMQAYKTSGSESSQEMALIDNNLIGRYSEPVEAWANSDRVKRKVN